MTAALACINKLCIVVDVVQHLGIQMKIVNHYISPLKAFHTFNRQKPDIPGPRTD